MKNSKKIMSEKDHNVMMGVSIKKTRKNKKVTQVMLAKKSGLAQSTISKVENGQLGLSLYHYLLMERLLPGLNSRQL
jgi:predicted transcriptional regulator